MTSQLIGLKRRRKDHQRVSSQEFAERRDTCRHPWILADNLLAKSNVCTMLSSEDIIR